MAETSKVETTASEACTRSGAFALLLSLVLASLIPVWNHRKESMILGRYMGLRLNLVAALDALDENPLWEKYKLSHDPESLPIGSLVNLRINSTTLEPFDETGTAPGSKGGISLALKPQPPTHPAPSKLRPLKPTAPSAPILGIVVGFAEVQAVRHFLEQLNDSELLTHSRNASDFFNFSIYRWVLKRENLIRQNMLTSTPPMVVLESSEPAPQQPANFVPAVDKNYLLKYLTLRDVRELANAELPKISDTVKLGRDENEVELTTSSLPRSLDGASLFAQVLLFFVIVYFSAFTREVVSMTHFPSQATLFGVFAGSHWTLAVFFLALWTPVAVSVSVLLVSYSATSRGETIGLAVCSVLIGFAVASVYATLSRKSYFSPLFRLVMQRLGATRA